ncbi:MAG: ATP-binding protein [Chloroflexota bacterium]
MLAERNIYPSIEKVLPSPEAIVVTGMRRVGKTTLLKTIYDRLVSPNKIFLDLENPRNQLYFEETDYDAIYANLQLLGLKQGERAYVFLDEIQRVKTLPSIVKYLLDTYGVKFILSGSSSYYLKNQFSESLAGRKYIFELYPLTFDEFLRFKGLPSPPIERTSFALYETYKASMEEYLQFGGFPGVAQKTSIAEKQAALEDIFTSYYQLEVVQLSDFRKSHKIRDLLFLLLERTGAKLEISKLSSLLGLARETINDYLAFLAGTYFIHLVSPYTTSRDVEIRKAPKIYICDPGLARLFAQVDEGALFENAVYCNLLPRGRVQYYQRKNGLEIDFIQNQQGYEVKLHPHADDIRKAQVLGSEIGLTGTLVVSRDYVSSPGVIHLFQL